MAAAVALVAACGTAQAAVITYDFAGTLDSVPTATELSQFTLGEAFSGSWTVDDSVGPHMPLINPGAPGNENQFDALVSYHATIGSYSISLTGGPTELIRVTETGSNPNFLDGYVAQASSTNGLTGPSVGPFSLFDSSIDIQEDTPSHTAFNGFDISTHFPTSLNLASFDEARFRVFFTSAGGDDGLSGPLSSLVVEGTTPVPEPSSICSALLGIGALGLSRMRKAKAKSDGSA
jgi:hypothetical protein